MNNTTITFGEIELTDSSVNEFDDHDDLYFSLPREKTSAIFGAAGTTPRNIDGYEDNSYVEGDIIVSFSRDEEEEDPDEEDFEITLAPVYENEDGYLDGDFIGLGESDFTPECIEFFKNEMRKLRKKGGV